MARILSLFVLVWIVVAGSGALGAQTLPNVPRDEKGQIQKGGQVVTQVCATCHTTIGRMLQVHRQSREQWKDTVYFMISRGAQVMPNEIDPLIAYLAATAGPQTLRPGRPAADSVGEPRK
jgi:mono/diheme cytochrome c family protein